MPDAAPADPVASEDSAYARLAAELKGYRRNGAGLFEAASLTWAHHLLIAACGEAQENDL